MFGHQKAVKELGAFDADAATVADVEHALATVTKMRSWLDAKEAVVVGRSERLAAKGRGAGGRSTLTKGGRTSSRKAAKTTARAKTIAAAPELGLALSNGEIGTDHVDAVTRATADLDDDQTKDLLEEPGLADAARRMSPDPFNTYVRELARRLLEAEGEKRLERQKRATNLRKWVRRDGMHICTTEYDPETGATVFAEIDAEVDTMAQQGAPKNPHSAAHALAALIHRGAGAGPNTAPAEIIVVDVDTLEGGLHDHSICETQSGVHLPPETVRRISCDAVMTPNTIRSQDGTVLNAGREVRTANRAQRRALRIMYGTCAFADCERQFDWCQIQHIDPWKQGGKTDLANLIPLCGKHHHLVHEGGWGIRLHADRTLDICQPDGRPYKTIPLPSAAAAKGINHTRQQEHDAFRSRIDTLIANNEASRHRQTSHNRAA